MKCFSTKSQTKRLLKNLCIESLPFTMEMYDYGEFLNTFSVLIIKNPHIDIWVLKIDDEVNGRGIAYADLGASKTVRALLRKSKNVFIKLTIPIKMVLSLLRSKMNLKISKLR
jgi:hypothetical protein